MTMGDIFFFSYIKQIFVQGTFFHVTNIPRHKIENINFLIEQTYAFGKRLEGDRERVLVIVITS